MLHVCVGVVFSESWLHTSATSPAASFAYSSAASAAIGCGTGKSPTSDQSAVYRERACKDSTREAENTAAAGDTGTEGNHKETVLSLRFVDLSLSRIIWTSLPCFNTADVMERMSSLQKSPKIRK